MSKLNDYRAYQNLIISSYERYGHSCIFIYSDDGERAAILKIKFKTMIEYITCKAQIF